MSKRSTFLMALEKKPTVYINICISAHQQEQQKVAIADRSALTSVNGEESSCNHLF